MGVDVIKASDLSKKQGLQNKEKKVEDIIRFIKTRSGNHPNYSLFLGAGCSVTSNIRSAGELINQWSQEIFTELYPDRSYSLEHAFEEFKKNDGLKWFDPIKPYSTLFERRYDLARQRRNFSNILAI